MRISSSSLTALLQFWVLYAVCKFCCINIFLALCLPQVDCCSGCAAVPPELLTEGRLSRAADVYAFGVMIWEMATSSRAWAGMSHTQAGICLQAIYKPSCFRHSKQDFGACRCAKRIYLFHDIWVQHYQVLTAVGYNHKRPLFPDYVDKDIVVRR